MHLAQTKDSSLDSGGPQYYFDDHVDVVELTALADYLAV
jgi:hypothetical protein